jgi:predicted DNA-binding transcriptional regulator AlpA
MIVDVEAKERPSVPARKRAYRIPEFCEEYRLSRAAVYNEIKAGRLKIRKIGRATRIAEEDAEAWFAACAA